MFDNAPDLILLVDAEGRILQINATGEKTLGYALGELIVKAIKTVITEHFSDGSAEGGSLTLKTMKPMFSVWTMAQNFISRNRKRRNLLGI